jgi:hypothetical protein
MMEYREHCEAVAREVDALVEAVAAGPADTARRCAHELAVHRYDAQSARSATSPIEADLAEDGIEEIFVVIDGFAARGESAGRGDGERLSLEPTDRAARWLVQLTTAGLRVNPDDPGSDLALRGTASDLELLLYHRPTIGDVERVGDEGALDAWYRAFHFG